MKERINTTLAYRSLAHIQHTKKKPQHTCRAGDAHEALGHGQGHGQAGSRNGAEYAYWAVVGQAWQEEIKKKRTESEITTKKKPNTHNTHTHILHTHMLS